MKKFTVILFFFLLTILLLSSVTFADEASVAKAIKNGKSIQLQEDIRIKSHICIMKDAKTVIDLNGHELGGENLVEGDISLSPGSELIVLDTTGRSHSEDNLTLHIRLWGEENVTLFGGKFHVDCNGGSLIVYGGDFGGKLIQPTTETQTNPGIFAGGGKVSLYGGNFAGELYDKNGNFLNALGVKIGYWGEEDYNASFQIFGGNFKAPVVSNESSYLVYMHMGNIPEENFSKMFKLDKDANYYLNDELINCEDLVEITERKNGITGGGKAYTSINYCIGKNGGSLTVIPSEDVIKQSNKVLSSCIKKYFPQSPIPEIKAAEIPTKTEDATIPDETKDAEIPTKTEDATIPTVTEDATIPTKTEDVVTPAETEYVVIPSKTENVVIPLKQKILQLFQKQKSRLQ